MKTDTLTKQSTQHVVDKNQVYYTETIQQLYQMIAKSKTRITMVLNNKKNTYLDTLRKNIIALTPWFDSTVGYGQRIHWIINDLHEFPICEECGKELSNAWSFVSFGCGYRRFCSHKCKTKFTMRHSNSTKRKRNHGKLWSKDQIETHRQRMKNPDVWKHNADLLEAKYGPGIRTQFQRPEIIQKIKDTKLEQHGDENWNNAEKARSTYQTKKQSDPNFAQSIIDKTTQTCLSRYGVKHPMQVPEIAERAYKNSRASGSRFSFNSQTFDSYPELCFYIWAKDNDLTVIRNPIDGIFQYEDAIHMPHLYHCDFKVVEWNQFVEIKGDNHFKDGDTTKPMISFKGGQRSIILKKPNNSV